MIFLWAPFLECFSIFQHSIQISTHVASSFVSLVLRNSKTVAFCFSFFHSGSSFLSYFCYVLFVSFFSHRFEKCCFGILVFRILEFQHLHQLTRMSELKENTKTEGTIFARFAKLENMIAMFSPDLPDVKNKLSCRTRFPN